MAIEDSAVLNARPASAQESAPTSMWLMAAVGLVPFPASALIFAFGPPEASRQAITVLLTWSAVVLAFLAGVRWGLESGRRVPRRGRLAGAVIFAMIAWGLLLARWRLELSWVLAAYLAAFMLQWLTDHAAPNTQARYPKLSTAITAAACISLAAALELTLRS